MRFEFGSFSTPTRWSVLRKRRDEQVVVPPVSPFGEFQPLAVCERERPPGD
jgi:hypothetical protein